jgi:predicted ATPase
MLQNLRIQNFKGWKDTGSIQMAPITLFFGTNSSGKSSIGQFLMMLKQTVESSDRKAVLFPGDKNSVVQLGSFQEMVFKRDIKKKISFNYEWNLNKELKFKDALTGKGYSIRHMGFEGKIAMQQDSGQTLFIEELHYKLNDFDDDDLFIGMVKKASGKKDEYDVYSENYPLKRNTGRVWYPGTPVRFYGFPDEVIFYHQNAQFVQSLNLEHENLFKSICYLGPLRTKTDRLYSWTGITPESAGYSGENTVSAMLAARDRVLNLGYKRPYRPFEQVIAESLKNMELIDDFKVKPISKQRQEYEVKVQTKGSNNWVDLPDVGFGISQVLPVLVQCFYAPANSIIIMEQPEIHLHPSAQSALADVMIDVINSKEDGKDRNIQLIIETHSEHFLKRIQRRIAEEKVSQDKISAYFAKVDQQPAKLEPLEIDLFGNIRNWPKNFFGDEMGDVTAHAKAAMEKRERQIESQKGLKNE